MNKYGLHGKLTAAEGKADQLAELLIQASELVAKTQGCHLYVISKDQTEPNSVWITEIWDSKEDHANSLKLDRVRALIGQAIPLLAGNPQGGQELDIIGGFGIQ